MVLRARVVSLAGIEPSTRNKPAWGGTRLRQNRPDVVLAGVLVAQGAEAILGTIRLPPNRASQS